MATIRACLAHVHVWIPKQRKKVLVGKIKIRLAAILSEVATEKGWLIKGLEIALLPRSCLSRTWYAIHKIVKALKGR